MSVNATYNDEEGGESQDDIEEGQRLPIDFTLDDRNNL
jgi:hypothetical protein